MAQVAAMRKAVSVSSLVTAVAAYPDQDSSSSSCSPVGWSSALGRGRSRSRASSVTSLASSSSGGDTAASFHVKTGLSTATQLTVR